MEEFKPVIFKVGNQKFGVDIAKVQGIEKKQRVVPVPNTEEYFIGIINLRGDVIPVYSLRKKLGIREERVKEPQYIIVWIKDTVMALEVDSVDEIHNLETDTLHRVPPIIERGETRYIRNVINSGKDLIIVINIDELLTDDELARMDNLVKQQ